MLSERIFPTFPSEILPENASTLAYGPYGTVAIASGSLINFAFISNYDKSSNNINIKEIKPMFSISVGLNLVTALKFDTNRQLCADPILYIGDSAGNIFIYNYQKHEYLAVFSPNGHWKDDRYVHVQQIEIDFLPDSRLFNRSDDQNGQNEEAKMQQKSNNSSSVYKNKNIIVLFKSKKIVSYSIIQENGEIEQLPIQRSHSDIAENLTIKIDDDSNESNDSGELKMGTKNDSSYNNSFYKTQSSNSIDSISSALNFTVNWVIDLESEMTNFTIDPFTNKKIFLYNKNKDNSFTILNLELIDGSFSSISSPTEQSEETISNHIIPKIAFSSSLNKYDFQSYQNANQFTPFTDTEIVVHRYSTIQCVQFSRHIQGHVYILTEHELILYNIDLDLFTRVNLTNLTSQKSAHFDKIIQFETDHRKILLVYKTGAMALFSLNSLFILNGQEKEKDKISFGTRRRRSVSDFKPSDRRMSRMSDSAKEVPLDMQISSKAHARDDQDVKFPPLQKANNEESQRSFSFKAISEVKQVVQSQQFVNCASPPLEADRDDILVFLYHPFGIALFDISRMKIVSCCPLFSDKTICYSTNEKFVAYGSCQGNIRIRSIFDNSFFFSLHVLDDPIKFISISNKFAHHKNKISQINANNGLNGIHVYFASDKKVGEFCFDTRKLYFFPSPTSFSIKKAIGSHSGGLIVQRDDETAGVFVNGNEVFLSLPENDKIIDICFNESENDTNINDIEKDENFVGQDEKGSFMILRKNNIVELYKYNKYTKYSFTDNNYNCSSFNFLNDNRINNNTNSTAGISPAAMKRRIIAHPSTSTPNSPPTVSKNKEKEKETKFVESTCVSLSGVDYALGFNDGSVFLLKTDDQTFAKRVEVLSSIPIVQMKFCNIKNNNNKINRVLFCLTGDQILCEVNLLNEEITSKVTISHVEAFSVINSSFIMVKNETNNINKIDNNNSNINNINNNNNNGGISSLPNSNNSINSNPSNSNIKSISSKSNLIGSNNNNEEIVKTNFLTPYDDDLIYPFPVISKYKKIPRKRTRSILQEESSSSTNEEVLEIEEDSSYTILEKSLSFPVMKEILKQFILFNPLPQILKEVKESNQNIEESFEKLWFLLIPSIFDHSNKRTFLNHLFITNRNRVKKHNLPIGRFGSPLHLPYSTDIGRDFWLILLERPTMQLECLYASGENALEYEVALSRILEGVASLSTSKGDKKVKNTPSSSLVRHALTHHHLPTLQSHHTNNNEAEKSALQALQASREKKYSMELFYALVYAHRYDEATNALTYNPDSDTFMSNTILAAALLGFSEFDISSSSSSTPKTTTTTKDGSGLNSKSVPSFSNNNNNNNGGGVDGEAASLSLLAREQQYAVIKHAATQMIMLSTKTGRLIEGANLLRLSQLDSFAASILMRANQVGLAMKFIRGMKSDKNRGLSNRIRFHSSQNRGVGLVGGNESSSAEKAGFCYEIGAKCFMYEYFKEAAFFFLTANEHFLALLSFFLFARNNFHPIFKKSPDAFNIHFASAICDIFFLKMYLNEAGLLVEPLLSEKDEVLRKKKLEKLGPASNVLSLAELKDEIDNEFKIQISHLIIDEKLFFASE